MINAGQIEEILSLYKKHGWNLRRVLLSDALRKRLADSIEKLFGSAEVVSSNIDAAWFSRPSRNNREAWELRHLSETPFALFETIGDDTSEAEREEIRREMEDRLGKLLSRNRN